MFAVSAFTRRHFAHETGFCLAGVSRPDCNVIAEQGGGPDARPSWAGSGPRAGGCQTLLLLVNLKLLQHITPRVLHSTQITVSNVGHDGIPVCFDTIGHLRFEALARQQAIYTMCFAQTAQHLYSLVQTKHRSFFEIAG